MAAFVHSPGERSQPGSFPSPAPHPHAECSFVSCHLPPLHGRQYTNFAMSLGEGARGEGDYRTSANAPTRSHRDKSVSKSSARVTMAKVRTWEPGSRWPPIA